MNRATKSNPHKKQSKKEHENMVVKNATRLITQYNEAYENQIADLKNAHLKELAEKTTKFKSLREWFWIVFITLSGVIAWLLHCLNVF